MKKKHLKVIKEIQDSIPEELILNITKKEKQFSTLKEVAEHALSLPTGEGEGQISAKEKRKLKSLLASGYLEVEVEVINGPVEEQIAAYFDKEIQRAIKEGRLPKKAPTIRHKSLINKGKKYVKKRNARLKALFGGADENPVGGNNPQDKKELHARNDNGKVLPQLGIEGN